MGESGLISSELSDEHRWGVGIIEHFCQRIISILEQLEWNGSRPVSILFDPFPHGRR